MKGALATLALLAALGLALALGRVAGAGGPAADLVLRGADVYTVDAARSWATAVAIGGGRIRWVGDAASAERFIGEQTRVLDLPGRFILPGFQDAHVHPVTSGVEVNQCDLSNAGTEAEVLDAVRGCADRKPEGWLLGGGWQLPIFSGAEPSKEALDAIVGARPAYLAAADGHSAWVSSRALEIAGVGADTPDPPRGRIERHPESGEPSGTLREAAMELVGRWLPEPAMDERLAGLRLAQERLLAHGVTAIQEAHATPPVLETYAAAAGRGELRLRVTAALATDPARGVEQVAELVDLRGRFYGGPVQATAAKIFVDGVIEARTAAMLEPYLDPTGQRPAERGTLEWQPERLNELVAALCRDGFDVHFHAIGDAGVRAALDAVEAAGTPHDPRRRHQIAHLEVIHPDDLPRFRRLGVIANFQPLWAHADSYIVDLTWPALGPLRSSWIYPIASVARAGGILAFGSDWSVSSLDPLEGIQVAVTRRALPGDPDGGEPMQPAEIVDLPTAIAAYTIGSAWAGRRDAISGSIEPGKSADLAVLSANPFELPPREIASARVLLTLIEGEIVHRAEEMAGAGRGVASDPQASLIVAGGDIVTLDPERPRARAMAVLGERILAVGDEAEIARHRGETTAAIDLAGRAVVPGFVDHHVHLLNLGLSLLNAAEGERLFIELAGLDLGGIAGRIAERASATPQGEWILGKGWSQGAWGEAALPSHDVLTAAAPGHPVYLSRVDGHAGWVNAAALAAASIDAATPDPPGGAIRRSPDGAPTGVLLERANELVQGLLPAPSDADVTRAFRLATDALARQGVVEVFDAGFLPMPGVVGLGVDLGRYLELLRVADREAPLAVAVNLMIPAPSRLAERILAAPEAFRRLSPRLAVTHLKLFADGALGSRGGAMTRPYADDPSTMGVRRMTPAEIRRWSAEALAAGFDVAVHAIGDAAVRDALDVFDRLLRERPGLDAGRLRVEHFSFAARADMERAARLGVVLSVQPGFVAPDDRGLAMEDARIGSPDSERVYAFGSLLGLGARLALGSDLFTAPGPPLATFHAAVTRRNANGRPAEGWHAAERVTRADALRLLTSVHPAGGGPPRAGRLAAGAPADFVILSADPLTAADGLLSVAVDAVARRGAVSPAQP